MDIPGFGTGKTRSKSKSSASSIGKQFKSDLKKATGVVKTTAKKTRSVSKGLGKRGKKAVGKIDRMMYKLWN